MRKALNLFFSFFTSLNFIHYYTLFLTKVFLVPVKFFICFTSIFAMLTIKITILRNLNVSLSDTDTLIFYLTLISFLFTSLIFIFLFIKKIQFSDFVKVFTVLNAFFAFFTSILILTYGCLFNFRILFSIFFISCILLNINKKGIVQIILSVSVLSCVVVSCIILYTWDCTIPLRIIFGISSCASVISSIYLSFKK